MERKLNYFLIFVLASVLFCQCKPSQRAKVDAQQNAKTIKEDEKRNDVISLQNKQAWEEAKKVRDSITDTTFLKTKQIMSDDAIAPYDYQTGLVGDRAYNQIVYIKALERARKHLSVKNNKVVCNVKSGMEIRIAEDLYDYIIKLFDYWNMQLESGKYEIIKADDGYYEVAPIPKRE